MKLDWLPVSQCIDDALLRLELPCKFIGHDVRGAVARARMVTRGGGVRSRRHWPS